jgi:hypothetical protein
MTVTRVMARSAVMEAAGEVIPSFVIFHSSSGEL